MNKFYKCPKCQGTLVYGITPCPECKSSIEWNEQSGPKLIAPSNIQPAKPADQPVKPVVQPAKPGAQLDKTAFTPGKTAAQPDKPAAKPVKKSTPVWILPLVVVITLACIIGLFSNMGHSESKSSDGPAIPKASTSAPNTATAPSTSTTAEETTFIGNESTKVFHYPSCHLVSELKSSNKVVFQSYSEAIKNGYKPCGVCKPH